MNLPLALVIVVSVAFVVLFLWAGVSATFRPIESDLYAPTRHASCSVTQEPNGVLLAVALEPQTDPDPRRWHLWADDTGNATVVGTDIWAADVGFGPGDVPPTTAMATAPWHTARYGRTTDDVAGAGGGTLVVALSPTNAGEPIEIDSLRVLTTTGEPVYAQTFDVHLRATADACDVSVGGSA